MTETLVQHGLTEHSHGGGIPVQTRSERFSSYDVADFAPINKRDALWKLTPIDRLAPVTGELDGAVYDFEFIPQDGITAAWVDRNDPVIGSSDKKPEDRVSAGAWSTFEKALHIRIAQESENAEPATLVRSTLGDTPRAAHTVITAEKFSRSVVVLDNRELARIAENIEIVVEDEAQLTVITIQDWDRTAVHAASHFAKLGRNAKLKHIVVTLGGDVVRIIPSTTFAGPGGEVEMFGLYFADAGQHQEQHVFVDHAQPNCKSRVTYKGALQGEKAHTVWIGDVLIRAAAEGTDTYEMNRNLILTDGARSDSIPNLEIETGEIVGAGHASATGRFDDEHLFYLQSRGIDELEARRLVVRGFLMEVVQQIGNRELEDRLAEALEHELANTVI